MASTRYSFLRRNTLTLPARSVMSFDFTTNQPNYFRLQNRGGARVYCSTGSMPTSNNYDFFVDGEKVRLFAQPTASNRLYVFNPSGDEIEVVCVSFFADFDPLTYALSDIEVTVPSTIESTSIISGFNAALPAGSNKIGSVDVENLINYTNILNSILTACNNIVSKLTNAESTGY